MSTFPEPDNPRGGPDPFDVLLRQINNSAAEGTVPLADTPAPNDPAPHTAQRSRDVDRTVGEVDGALATGDLAPMGSAADSALDAFLGSSRVTVLADTRGWVAVRLKNDDPNVISYHRKRLWSVDEWDTWTVKDVLAYRKAIRDHLNSDPVHPKPYVAIRGDGRREEVSSSDILDVLDALVPSWVAGLDRSTAFDGLDMTQQIALGSLLDRFPANAHTVPVQSAEVNSSAPQTAQRSRDVNPAPGGQQRTEHLTTSQRTEELQQITDTNGVPLSVSEARQRVAEARERLRVDTDRFHQWESDARDQIRNTRRWYLDRQSAAARAGDRMEVDRLRYEGRDTVDKLERDFRQQRADIQQVLMERRAKWDHTESEITRYEWGQQS